MMSTAEDKFRFTSRAAFEARTADERWAFVTKLMDAAYALHRSTNAFVRSSGAMLSDTHPAFDAIDNEGDIDAFVTNVVGTHADLLNRAACEIALRRNPLTSLGITGEVEIISDTSAWEPHSLRVRTTDGYWAVSDVYGAVSAEQLEGGE